MSYTDSQPVVDSATVTIVNGTSLSPAVDLYGSHLVGIVMPAAWTAGALTFTISYDGINFAPMYDNAGVEISYTVTVGAQIKMPDQDFRGVRAIKLLSGTHGTPVNQLADRIFRLIVRFGP